MPETEQHAGVRREGHLLANQWSFSQSHDGWRGCHISSVVNSMGVCPNSACRAG